MKTVIVSCRTVEDEVSAAMQRSGVDYPVEWVESGLHNTPLKLTARLQEILDGIDAERVLLAMGYCGNSLAGLRTGNFELIVPRVDDCISLLLGSVERRVEVSRELAAYFFTEGWLRGERNAMNEYDYTMEKYGEEVGATILDMMYSHYRTLAILDCGYKSVDNVMERTASFARALNLEQKKVDATLSYIERLFTGDWPEDRFLRVPPHSTVAEADLSFSCESTGLQ